MAVAVGDYVIVHVGYALARLDPEEAAAHARPVRRSGAGAARGSRHRPHEVHRRIPRRRAGPAARRGDRPRGGSDPQLQPDGVLRRPYARHLALRHQGSAAGQRAHDPRPRLPGVRAADRPHRQRHRARRAARADPRHLRRHDARAGVEGPVAAEGQGARRRHPHGVFERRCRAHRARQPATARSCSSPSASRPRRRRPRSPSSEAAGAGPRQLQRVLQPCADAGGDRQHSRIARGARARHGSARRLHRARARLDGDRQPALRVSSPRNTAGRWSSPASSRST